MKTRTAIMSTLTVATLAVAGLAGAPLAAQASGVPEAAKAQVSQPYTHLVTGHTWSTGGTYVSTGGDVKLKLSALPKATEILVEECEGGHDLGDVQVFTKKTPSHVLATGLAKGTCFLILFESQAKSNTYQITGTLTY
jgi:hypothetical protein